MDFFLYKARNCPFSFGDIEKLRCQVCRVDAVHYSRQVREVIYIFDRVKIVHVRAMAI